MFSMNADSVLMAMTLHTELGEDIGFVEFGNTSIQFKWTGWQGLEGDRSISATIENEGCFLEFTGNPEDCFGAVRFQCPVPIAARIIQALLAEWKMEPVY